ncbi:MAG: ABC transporter substrate-binding protein [Acidimicrobiia bacterium]|nr:ABC transporter substrate-binding protein [Acidimicrobiia bacterium]MYB24336.1 ABC transporter substrate-binding protein [Acidimicrobiia bacterium]MYJ13631.1 ABC transporter substrate-binding protein [Acidimicrobiia bacterium]
MNKRVLIALAAALAVVAAACAADDTASEAAEAAAADAAAAASAAAATAQSAQADADTGIADAAVAAADAAAAAADAAAAAATADAALAAAEAAQAGADLAQATAEGNVEAMAVAESALAAAQSAAEEALTEAAAAQQEAASAQAEADDARAAAEAAQAAQAEAEAGRAEAEAEAEAAMAGVQLTDVCPNPLVIQTDWFPEPEHAHTYQMIGTDGVVDAENGTYSGELRDTGLTVEIRAGGPYIGFSPPTAQFYADDDIFMAYVDTAAAIRSYGQTPVTAVFTSFEVGPQILMWDPDDYDFETFEDIGNSGATVLYFQGATYMDYLVANGVIDAANVDGSYDGSPTRFIAEDGLVQQGFATNEPFRYENEIDGWLKPVEFLLIHDAGVELYQSAVSVRSGDIERYRECLELIVPIMQEDIVAYFNDPQPINDKLDDIVKELDSFWTSSKATHAAATVAMRDLGLVTDGGNGFVGDMNGDRIQGLIDILTPIFTEQGVESFDPNITPDDVYTNEFLDPSISLGF